jgi:site-specific DNA recombinase
MPSYGGKSLLGYKVNSDKTYAVDEATAPIVRKIFRLYLRGYSYNNIIDQLNREGVKTGSGRSFGKNSIHDSLKNERYAGVTRLTAYPK